MNIIGLTGYQSSGKDTAAEVLAEQGFLHISTSDLIRKEMTALGMPIDRDHIREFATNKRLERGAGYLTEQASLMATEKTVISGLRNVEEVEILRKKFGADFRLVLVDAPLETRYKWALARNRETDHITFEQFVEQQQKERASASQQIDAVIALADKTIVNDGALEDLQKKVVELI